jgi:hypothetical protein
MSREDASMENDVVRCGVCNAPAGPGFREMHLTAEAERLFRRTFPHLETLPSPGGLCAACLQLSPERLREQALVALGKLLSGEW